VGLKVARSGPEFLKGNVGGGEGIPFRENAQEIGEREGSG
jgi:hypothetical protein